MNDSTEKLFERIEKYRKNEDLFSSKIHGAEWVANPDDKGQSITVYLNMLNGTNLSREHNSNGQTYLRTDTSWLFEKYDVDINRLNGGDNGKIISFRLNGFTKNKLKNKQIRKDIRVELSKERIKCPHSGLRIDNYDHKNGRYNNPRVLDLKTQIKEDIQGLHHTSNITKRTHCSICKKTTMRFDATILGYDRPYTVGGKEHDGSPNGCIGCYWYDVLDFTQQCCKQPLPTI